MNDSEETPRRKAVALRYDRENDQAPRVVAKGDGFVAERILSLAEEHGVTVYEDIDLTASLAQLDLHVEIPESLYRAVAEVLAFVYRLNRSKSDQFANVK